MSRSIFLALIFMFFNCRAEAQDGESSSGRAYKLGVDASIGYPQVRMENPSGGKVLYDGVAVLGELIVPLIDTSKFRFLLKPGVVYYDLYNKANSDTQKELANLIGPGVSAQIMMSNFAFGARYNKLWGRHFGTGTFSGTVNYQIDTISFYGGYVKRFGQLSIGGYYSTSTSEIPRAETGLSRSTPFQEQTYWINATFTTNQSLFEILGKLF